MVKLLAEDCFIIGRESYLSKDWVMSRDWMKQALQKYDEGKGHARVVSANLILP